MTGAQTDAGQGKAAAPPDDTQELLTLLHAVGVRPAPDDMARLVLLYAMLRGYSARLAELDLGDTPPAVAFDPAWE
jgi:hypothetical protein